MASSKSDTARPAARKGQSSAKSTKTMAKKTSAKPAPRPSAPRSRLEPIVQAVERPTTTKPASVELPKLRGELPVPTSTFYF